MILFEIHRNAEGSNLAYASSNTEDGAYRIAGPKAWGASKKLAEIEITDADMARFIIQECPAVMDIIKHTLEKTS